MKIDGRCHCGSISYVAEVDPENVYLCHCADCQTLSGAAYRVVAQAEPGSFKLLAGEPKTYVKTGEGGNKRVQAFCPNCGTPLYAHALAGDPHIRPPIIGLRMGAIAQRDQLPPKAQYWTRSRQHWAADIGALRSIEKQ
ncbi:MAG TPA: GFA family protein [Dongiaceae bacterium]|jgi:hypothetical protein|nr:GFA family protein [Dongiaceae bacterium]